MFFLLDRSLRVTEGVSILFTSEFLDKNPLLSFECIMEGRVTKETRPWGDGGKQMTRNVYAARSTRFYDNRPIKVYTDYETASGQKVNTRVVNYNYHGLKVQTISLSDLNRWQLYDRRLSLFRRHAARRVSTCTVSGK